MNIGQGKVFEKPAGGSYLATVADVIDLPNQNVTYNGTTKVVDKIIIKWVLSHINGAPYLDKEGKMMEVAAFPSAIQSAKSKLTKLLTQILNATPPLINSTEQLAQLIIGRSSQVFLTQEPDTRNPGQFFTNVAGIAPLPPGATPPSIAGYVRAKDRTRQTAGPNPGQTTPTYSQPPQQAPAVNLNAPAPNTNEAF